MSADVFGKAITDFFEDKYTEDIVVQAPDFDDDSIPLPYLFRTYKDMPAIEQKALELCSGHVLDVGCGAGSHSLYLQNQKKLKVTAIDISQGAVATCQKRGINHALTQNVHDIKNNKYDTLLFLMNGSGIIGRLSQIDTFLSHLKTILNPKGQILIDSSDISYLYQEEDGGFWMDMNATYYGEMKYKLKYKSFETDWFDWLYIDYNTLQNAALYNGFECKLIVTGTNNDYLAQLTLKKDTP